jgi:hypothetical protein
MFSMFNDLGSAKDVIFLSAFVIAVVFGIVIQYFFVTTLCTTLQNCRKENRKMAPEYVWLNFIPFFNVFWTIITVRKVAASLRAEFDDADDDYGVKVGLAYIGLLLLSLIPHFGRVFAALGFICFVSYWKRISKHNDDLEVKRVYASLQYREKRKQFSFR